MPSASPSNSTARPGHRFALGLLILLHLIATFLFMPPGELLKTKPIVLADHPFHAYDVHLYRQALWTSGLPWGCDPALSAGKVLSPSQDAGGRPQEVLGALLPPLAPGTLVRWFLFLGVLTFPLWNLLAARRLGVPPGAQLWSLAVLLTGCWLYQSLLGFFCWGQAAFAVSSHMSPFVLALFLGFLAKPSWRLYLGALAALSVMFLLHVLGPAVIGPSLLLFALFARRLTWRWRTASLLAPLGVLVLNAFWFVPFVFALGMPSPAGREFAWNPPDLTYLSVGQLMAVLSPLRLGVALIGVGLAAWGLILLGRVAGRRTAVAFGVAVCVGLSLKFGGSFVPGVYLTQPSRFFLGAVAMMTIPVGLVCHQVTARLRIPPAIAVPLFALSAIVAAVFMPQRKGTIEHVDYAGVARHTGGSFALRLPGNVPFRQDVDALTGYIAEHTAPEDRLLVQTVIQCEPLVLPMMTGREVIGNTYLDQHDPAQFLRNKLLGKPLDKWTAEQLRGTLGRWGVSWAFVFTPRAVELFTEATGEAGRKVGRYRAFRIGAPATRFLVGGGHLTANVNRIELSDLVPEDGCVILRYRYHPAWETTSGLTVHQHPVPEDPSGFIALKDPPPAVTLRFRPWRMLRAPWPSTSRHNKR